MEQSAAQQNLPLQQPGWPPQNDQLPQDQMPHQPPPPPHYGAPGGYGVSAEPRIPHQGYGVPAQQTYQHAQQPTAQPQAPQQQTYPQQGQQGYPQQAYPQQAFAQQNEPQPRGYAAPQSPPNAQQPGYPQPPAYPQSYAAPPQAYQQVPAQPLQPLQPLQPPGPPYPQQSYPPAPPQYPSQQPPFLSASASNPQLQPQLQPQPSAVSFPPPPNLPPVRDAFRTGAAPFLEPGEQVYHGFILKLDDTIEETPRELQIAIEGQHRTLGDINRASRKINRGMKWLANPLEAANERFSEKATEAINRQLAGPVFIGGWQSQAGEFIRFVRATAEDYGPGAYGAVTSHRYLVFRGARLGGSAMRLVYAVPRTAIAGLRLEGSKDAVFHGRAPRAELHFADGSMVATTMASKQGEQLAAVLQPQLRQGGR